MFKIESYVTPILLSYVDKYVRDFKPADAQVSLWGGGVALHNLVLKGDVLQQEVALPFTLVSGRIHELLIQVPWTKIISEPIIVTIDTIECVLSLNQPPSSDDSPPPESPSRKTQVVEAPPGYMQALVRRIVSNIALRVHHLIVKYVQDDIVMSLNVKHLAVDSAGVDWAPAFADIDVNQPVIRRLVRLDDFTLCLDKSDADGKIRFYQEPLLYRCQLDLRVLTRLISANTRRATSLNIQLRSTKLAWSVTNEQLILLLRLLRERPVFIRPQPSLPKPSVAPPLHMTSSNSAEPARSESWSEWAWSWLPTWMDREGGVEEAPVPATPLPLFFSAYLDDVSLVFKVMECEAQNNRKRARGVLELSATHAAIKSSVCFPTSFRVRFGTRLLELRSNGKCVCGYLNYNSYNYEPTVYLTRLYESDEQKADWKWPEEDLNEKVEIAEAVDESYRVTSDQSGHHEGDLSQVDNRAADDTRRNNPDDNPADVVDELWNKMAPILFVEYSHERSPPSQFMNPYDNPPKDFQYSDWVEECNTVIKLEPVELRVCMGLIHRVAALRTIYQDKSPAESGDTKPPMRTLTVEECESLCENLPEKRVRIEARGTRLRIIPWDHTLQEKPQMSAAVLDLELPKSSIAINGPMYPQRVCAAACQMPDDTGPLSKAARLHVTVTAAALQARVAALTQPLQRPCARADVRLVTHLLLNKAYFNRNTVEYSYHLKIKELSICGSSARLQTAYQVPLSLYRRSISIPLKHTSLPKDALNDEESVAVDFTLEDFGIRGYMTKDVNTHVVTLQSAKATAYYAPQGGELQQSWLLSAPDAPTTTPYLRLAVQWCNTSVDNSFDYCGVWAEPTSMSIDPLLIAWLAYKPIYKSYESHFLAATSSQNFLRRRTTPPSSSGRGASRTVSGAELVHLRSRSHASSSEPSEKKDGKIPTIPIQQKPPDTWWSGEKLVALHKRLQGMLLNVELGLALVYITMSSASALDCATLRDALERHACGDHRVLALSLGRLSMNSNTATKHIWQCLRHDGPTFLTSKPEAESFPWKLRLADVSCYTLEVTVPKEHIESAVFGKRKSGTSGGLRSNLRSPHQAIPRTVLELVTTSVTLSVVTKSIQYKTITKKEPKKQTAPVVTDTKTKYFTSGIEFRPTTLKEFVRGPAGRKRKGLQDQSAASTDPPEPQAAEMVTIKDGPVVSLGVHLHADTPPVLIRLEHEQLHIIAAAVHCLTHILTLLKQNPINISKQGYTSLGGSHRSLVRSVSEIDEIPTPSEDNDTSDNRSDLIPIFDRSVHNQAPLKTFFWFQWVVSHAALVVASSTVKLAFDIDDIISTVDIQKQYNQLKIKLASASIKHYERSGSEDWTAGVLGGRVLEAREPTNAKEESHFLAITITQAQISNLPASWKEELHPKLLEHKSSEDSMWEIYATLAPLEAVLQPVIMDNIMSLVKEMTPQTFCPIRAEVHEGVPTWQWPFLYITAGGIRLLITGTQDKLKNQGDDDTFIFSIGKVTINPHPDNPICRRAVSTGAGVTADGCWLAASAALEGRQYELLVSNVSLRSAHFKQLAYAEESDELTKGTTGENPALKWSQRAASPLITPILHTMDLSCVLAPALYVGGILTCGPAVELNLVSDCSLEISIAQLVLLKHLFKEFHAASRRDSVSEADILESPSYLDKYGICPYAELIMKQESDIFDVASDVSIIESHIDSKFGTPTEVFPSSVTADSGVETIGSSSKIKADEVPKKPMSVAFVEQVTGASEYLELFVTMGVIELSLYVGDDSSPEVIALRPPKGFSMETDIQKTANEDLNSDDLLREDRDTGTSSPRYPQASLSRSLTAQARDADIGRTLLQIRTLNLGRKCESNVPLLQVILYQPNVYYWRRKTQKTLQLSLFNAWVGLGIGSIANQWNLALLSTAKGVADPVTDIPPALATLKVLAPVATNSTSNANGRGTARLDVERPIQLEVCTDRLSRLKGIIKLLQLNSLLSDRNITPLTGSNTPALLRLRKFMKYENMESITIQTSQISLCGSEGTVGWDGASLQVSGSARPARLNARALLSALLVAAGAPGDRRHVVMHPLILGVELEAYWEAWRRAEGGPSAREPSVHIGIELDRLTLDLRPSELAACNRLQNSASELFNWNVQRPPAPASSIVTMYSQQRNSVTQQTSAPWPRPRSSVDHRLSPMSINSEESVADHYYTDDLRSGAFKILSGGQLPMAYQVILHGNAVSWSYPHPRAITRVVAFPLPGQDTELDCVLELYTPMLGCWQPHTYFKIPVGEPRELQLYVSPPDTVFATMWRFRTCMETDAGPPPFEFNINKFVPRSEPLVIDHQAEVPTYKCTNDVTASQLSGILRVDSYFAPRLLPLTQLILRFSEAQLCIHNALPSFYSPRTNYLEGYYVSKPLMRSHRVLSLAAHSFAAHAHIGSPAGHLCVLDTQLSCDIVDCATGTMEQLVDKFRLQGGISSRKESAAGARTRVATSGIHVSLHVPRMRTIQTLVDDWSTAYQQYITNSSPHSSIEMLDVSKKTKHEIATATAVALEGRVSLWIHNSCASALRVGQEGTDEVVPLGPGARLAYRWRSPTSPKKLRFALAGPTADWHWSSSIPFMACNTRLRLEGLDQNGNDTLGQGVHVHVKVEETGARRYMHLSGRLVLANMLRQNLLYKVRALCPEAHAWRSVVSGELPAETVGRSVVCATDCDMVLKIKFGSHDSGWSGDIPLKECPKENVPWLVKVPSEGSPPFVAVWCRAVRARSDGRVLAAVWPLYVLRSHLPLDTDVLIATEWTCAAGSEPPPAPPPPVLQSALGRGASTHLAAPGTTAARHSLSFQYRNIECPVTREAVPLHYGVTDASVFDKRAPIATIEDVVRDLLRWLKRTGRNSSSSWPYSLVAQHWPGSWAPAALQPRCDVTVRYSAVTAGGGCCLELQLCPVALLCNATLVSLTLRAHDAAPLCKLEPGCAISPPSAILKKPFFMSVEMGRETFVSGQLQVSQEEPGRYGVPSPGHVTLDHSTNFSIVCNQKVALLTLYYEIKEDINILGVTSTYMLINRLNQDIMVSAIAVPNDMEDEIILRPKTFKVVSPTKEDSILGVPLSRFWLRGRWRGGDLTELRTYLCVSLPAGANPGRAPAPVRLGQPPLRRAIALLDVNKISIPIVVSQIKHEGRWLVLVSPDLCPQFVVHNHTRIPFAVGQPLRISDEPSSSYTREPAPECAGARWACVVPPATAAHYSSPAHCARFPPPAAPAAVDARVPFLTFARGKDEAELDWCAPVAVAAGEQLLQFYAGITVKLRVLTHPHSTLLELHEVDENDISASDIRRRLFAFQSNEFESKQEATGVRAESLERINATSRLFADEEEGPYTQNTLTLENVPVIQSELSQLVSSINRVLDKEGSTMNFPLRSPTPDTPKPEPTTLIFMETSKERGTDYTAPMESKSSRSSKDIHRASDMCFSQMTFVMPGVEKELSDMVAATSERVRCVVAGVVLELSASADVSPLCALHLDRTALLVQADTQIVKTVLSIADAQIDNLQYESGQYDFAVIASTRAEALDSDRWPALWNMFAEKETFATREASASLLLQLQHDKWTVVTYKYSELTEVDIKLGALALYVEDAYVKALVELFRLAVPSPAVNNGTTLSEERSIQSPLRLRALHVHPLDLSLTLHTSVRMYIALDQSPLRLSAFKLHDMMTSAERLTHALTVHYLSAAILGAGWVVGGLELLGAPGALAARLSAAGAGAGAGAGGVRGAAAACAAALLRSLCAWAGSLARNLDLLGGDPAHAERAAAARRASPHSLAAGLRDGLTNFAINMLGAVGGLAHHPLVGVAVGESDSGAAALRRGLLGALTKPLSATADLVAAAGTGLLRQAGWDPAPQPRRPREWEARASSGWQRDCVRWTFRLCELSALSGCEVLLDNAPLQLLLTHKFLVVADPETERIVEMIDLRFCTLGPYKGEIIELCVTQRRQSKMSETRAVDEDDEIQISAAAMARVARYTGAAGSTSGASGGEARVLALLPAPHRALALHAALVAALHHNADTHFPLL